MQVRRLGIFAMAAVLAGSALSPKAQGADITVGKGGGAMFATVQAAVDAAAPGQVIEIVDTEVYEEQVTVDSTKNGITIRSRNPMGMEKPVIRWQDVTNRGPRSYEESQVYELAGQYERCGALRIIGAAGVTLDGIAIDGGGAAPFGFSAVWSRLYAHFHGNSAVSLVAAGGAVIRNCELRNAYFGIYVKDRNPGGAFASPNPSDIDIDANIPLSRFGRAGNHLIEYNRVHGNSVGFFIESNWDLGSTVRYNLIFNNFHTPATVTAISGMPESSNQVSGAFLFKDATYSPVAIYNNTFYNNTGNFFGNFKVGTPHLIFNNIYGKPYSYATLPGYMSGAMTIDHRFPNRMNNSLFSAIEELRVLNSYIQGCTDPSSGIFGGQSIPGIDGVRVTRGFPSLPSGPVTVTCLPPLGHITTTTTNFVPHGALISGTPLSGTSPQPIHASANLRWLETSQRTPADFPTGSLVSPLVSQLTEDLFESTDPESPDFLKPKWDHPLVQEFIRNQGWGNSEAPNAPGIRNHDGSDADIGAIPSSGAHQRTVVRITPSTAAMISGTNANAMFHITVEGGRAFNNPQVKFLRWVAPLPIVTDNWGADAPAIPAASIRNITPPNQPLRVGSNSINVSIGTGFPNAAEVYGFFEIVVEGTDASGNLVTSDVGFLPYRNINYSLDIALYPIDGDMTAETELLSVTAGEHVRMAVKPVNLATGEPLLTLVSNISYNLYSDAAAMIYRADNDEPLAGGEGLLGERVYNVYFTRAGQEIIAGAGVTGGIAVLGSRTITVLPSVPSDLAFVSITPVHTPDPVSHSPESRLSRSAAAVSNTYSVDIMVQDRFGNGVNTEIPVNLVSSDPDAVSISPPAAPTNPATGIANFTVYLANASPGDKFELTASIDHDGITASGAAILEITDVTSIQESAREIPPTPGVEEAAVVPPVAVLTGEFTAGPNPVSRQSGSVNFFWDGGMLNGGKLSIYDASGNLVKRVSVNDRTNAESTTIVNTQNKRLIGTWDLRDRRGRMVSEGTYLVRGVVTLSNGKEERVSLILGVR
ncbi:MAG: hypothetical protein LBC70_04325 [Chitinispirillales bacterium]|jgi:hypothetical protein|nr:hypothetical protein [Chitinispirillales bacterium]